MYTGHWLLKQPSLGDTLISITDQLTGKQKVFSLPEKVSYMVSKGNLALVKMLAVKKIRQSVWSLM